MHKVIKNIKKDIVKSDYHPNYDELIRRIINCANAQPNARAPYFHDFVLSVDHDNYTISALYRDSTQHDTYVSSLITAECVSNLITAEYVSSLTTAEYVFEHIVTMGYFGGLTFIKHDMSPEECDLELTVRGY